MALSLLATDKSPAQRLQRAVAFMMLSVATYAIQDVFVKLLPPEISVWQISFFRGIFALIPIAMVAFFEDKKPAFKTDHWKLHMLRSFFSCLALFFFIGAFRLIPLADAYTLTFSCPIFLAAFSIPLLKEKVPLANWLAILTGFCGV